MIVTIRIRTDNAAFDGSPGELARIIRVAADYAERGQFPQRLRDINGNVVGIMDEWEDNESKG